MKKIINEDLLFLESIRERLMKSAPKDAFASWLRYPRAKTFPGSMKTNCNFRDGNN